MTALDKILDRLEGAGLKKSGPDRYMARCGAHLDKTPSLSIRGMEDGRVLLHCFGGCETGDVLAAMGLSFADLFDKPLAHHLPPIRGGFSARELLDLNAHETYVVELLAEKAAAGEALTVDEIDRLRTAAARLGKARVLANV
jgi:hypothetical protein